MKVKKISLKELEDYLCEGMSIKDILEDGCFDELYIKEWNATYHSHEEGKINSHMRDFLQASYIEESQKNRKDEIR